MGRQYAKTPGLRASIIEACSVAFSESGFHGVSMAEIARRAGISHTGLLHHFPRKEILLTAVLELQDERGERYLRDNGVLSGTDDPVAVLRGMIVSLVERDRHAGLVELSATLSGEATSLGHPAHDFFADRYRRVRSFLTRLFTVIQEEQRLSSALPPEHLAALTIAVTDGLHTQWLYARDELDVESIIHDFLASIVKDFDAEQPIVQ
ncbi:TetR/AcrR family transcriptional regulator [Arthrobacter sp. EH-1B-1]|uniref:TetR/AcrR family transcriptional regulator n=1 Tax=Arthrobacter vasquezii TaxID=2977629 RepID=A0ABT6CU89_9MICC|nr:TetR/AcrR family transcriptional regulator [Arthrobacter vasquezii]MDF9277630.1 TetR/AcrR family transcriptional regulator [Arthrobacter vasquezii]